jgi:hypothetical protein
MATPKAGQGSFVCFNNHDEATKTVAEINKNMVNGKPLYIAHAQQKDVRKKPIGGRGVEALKDIIKRLAIRLLQKSGSHYEIK